MHDRYNLYHTCWRSSFNKNHHKIGKATKQHIHSITCFILQNNRHIWYKPHKIVPNAILAPVKVAVRKLTKFTI